MGAITMAGVGGRLLYRAEMNEQTGGSHRKVESKKGTGNIDGTRHRDEI